MADFKPGDVVCLKSGGPKMTIHSVNSGNAICLWFAGDEVHDRSFGLQTLELASDVAQRKAASRARALGRPA